MLGIALHAIIALFFLWTNQQLLGEKDYPNSLVIVQRKPCPGGCGQRGHCNYEEGRCECPWGYAGPSCEVDRMAVCKQTTDDPGSCGYIMPKNCECYRECFRLYCKYGTDTDKCAHQIFGADIFDASCWLYGSEERGPAEARLQNSSRYPEYPETETVWYGKIPEMLSQTDYTDPKLKLKDPERRFVSPWDRPWLVWHRAPNTALPLSRCNTSNGCSNGRGACILRPEASAPECICRYGFNGTDCSQSVPELACWFSPDCGGRGRCVSGFCHCRDGHWGWGCHRSTPFQPQPPQGEPQEQRAADIAWPPNVPDLRSKTSLRIYMYELPWEIAMPYEMREEPHTRDAIYTAYEYFMKYFLKDDIVRTESPYEANLFYVPLFAYFYADNVRNAQWQAQAVIDWVAQRWPFYNRSGGHDHFLFLPADRGSCESERWLQDGLIKVVHFGLQKRNLNWNGIRNKDYACIQAKRDLVVPPRSNDKGELGPTDAVPYYQRLVSNGGHDANRTLLFFFAGGVGDHEYSGGARRAIQLLLKNLTEPPPDVLFAEGSIGEEYAKLLRTSKFCIAPYGHGWGIRLMQSIHFGCIPVIIQDNAYQPYEDFLPYEDFSVRMRVADVPHIIELLRSYSYSQVVALRLGLAKHFRAFIWEREFGGMAYEWTLAGLQRRLYNLEGQY